MSLQLGSFYKKKKLSKNELQTSFKHQFPIKSYRNSVAARRLHTHIQSNSLTNRCSRHFTQQILHFFELKMTKP